MSEKIHYIFLIIILNVFDSFLPPDSYLCPGSLKRLPRWESHYDQRVGRKEQMYEIVSNISKEYHREKLREQRDKMSYQWAKPNEIHLRTAKEAGDREAEWCNLSVWDRAQVTNTRPRGKQLSADSIEKSRWSWVSELAEQLQRAEIACGWITTEYGDEWAQLVYDRGCSLQHSLLPLPKGFSVGLQQGLLQ